MLLISFISSPSDSMYKSYLNTSVINKRQYFYNDKPNANDLNTSNVINKRFNFKCH